MAVYVVLIIAIVETSIVSTSVFVSRRVFGYIFTNEKEVVDYVTRMAPLLCLNILMDSLQGTLSGNKAYVLVLMLFFNISKWAIFGISLNGSGGLMQNTFCPKCFKFS